MKIYHVIPSLNPASGGPPVVAARLAAAQAALGCQTRLIAYRDPSAQANIDTDFRTLPGIANVQVDYLPPPTRLERIFAPGARRQFASLFNGADLIHLHGIWYPIISAAAAAASKLHIPYVVTPHGMLDQWSMSQKKLKKQIALALGYRKMLDHAAFLHYLNSDERDLAAVLKFKSNTQVIPNGIFMQELDPLPAKGEFRRTQDWLREKPFILFLSRLHTKKGLDYLADAFAIVAKQFPDAQLVIAGPEDGAGQAFRQQIKQLKIDDRTHLIGPIYGTEKFRALVDCNCFCLPSRQEGFSIAITEALACQTPVVISTACHFPEVQEASAGIITDLDPQKIAEAIAKILCNPTKAQEMGQSGRNLVTTRFTWPQVAKKMIEAYETAAPR
jgi:glycosyltransferase involved in cell wall biosynthesis